MINVVFLKKKYHQNKENRDDIEQAVTAAHLSQPMGNPQHNQLQPAHSDLSLKWHILSRFWQGIAIKKSVRFSWTDTVFINSGHVFSSKQAIGRFYLHM